MQKSYESTIPIYSPTLTMKTYNAINLPFALYGCEMWSLTLREHKLHVSKNEVLSKILGYRNNEVAIYVIV